MIELREHNVKPYHDLCAMLEDHDKVAYVSATGTGKTYVGGKYIEDHDLLEKTLILVPSDAIRDNWKKILPETDVLSYQAMLRNKPDMGRYEMLICDEMHHLGAEIWGAHYKGMTDGYSGRIIGMSATPVRFLDNSRNMIEELFEGVRITGVELPEAIQKGILPSFDYVAALYNLPSLRPHDTGRCTELTKKLYKQLDVMENEYSFRNIIRKHMKPGVHKVAVFIPHIDSIDEYKDVVSAVYPDALHCVAHSNMPPSQRAEAIDAFEQNAGMSFLYTVDLLNEGVHIDGVDTVIMFRKTQSPTIFLQQLGRALTANATDERITIFDFVANHVNVKTKHDGASSVIDWINDGSGNPARQVIKFDYASAEREVLDRISFLLGDVWKEEENALIRQYYGRDGAKETLTALLPTRNWKTIVQQAWTLGLGKKYKRYASESLTADVIKLFPIEGGRQMLEAAHPDVPWASICSIAKKAGIFKPHKMKPWTDEEDAVILKHASDSALLQTLLPDRTMQQIWKRRRQLGLAKSRPVFTEDHRRIMLENQHMSTQQMQRTFFPDWSATFVAKKREELGVLPDIPEPFWTKEVNAAFSEAYIHGGSTAVLENPLFAHMTRKQIADRAGKMNIKTIKRQSETCVRFSDSEIELLTQWVIAGDTHSDDEILRLFPGHTIGSVRVKMRKIKRKLKEEQDA